MNKRKLILAIVGLMITVLIGMITSHSVWEIHYLKGFYPKSFTVIEASYASFVELIKVILIFIPLWFAYYVMRDFLKE